MKKITLLLLMAFIATVAFVRCDNSEKDNKVDYSYSRRIPKNYDLDTIGDARKTKEAAENNAHLQRRDSILKNVPIAKMRIRRDTATAHRLLLDEMLPDGTMALWSIDWYFNEAQMLPEGISLSTVADKALLYVGLKKASMDTWDSSLKKAITKFRPALSKAEQGAIAKTLLFNADLMDSLANLSDADQQKLIRLLDTIVANRYNHYSYWLETEPANKVLVAEYNVLKKVWPMPKLVGGPLIEGEYGGHGRYYLLGKYVNNPWYGRNYYLLWNTRYLNRYQYAVGVFHRRCRDVKAKTPAERRAVATHIASTMRFGASLLR